MGGRKEKIHQSLSHLPEHAAGALERALRDGTQPGCVDINAVVFEEAVDFGDAWAACRVAEDLGILDQLEQLPEAHRLPIQAMIIDRVINPKGHGPKPLPKQALASEYPDSGLSRILQSHQAPPLPVWYQALESLADHQKAIRKGLFQGGSKRIFLYDITSAYFEGKCCPLAAFGYNRDGKKGKLQIVVGPLMQQRWPAFGGAGFQGQHQRRDYSSGPGGRAKERFWGVRDGVCGGSGNDYRQAPGRPLKRGL